MIGDIDLQPLDAANASLALNLALIARLGATGVLSVTAISDLLEQTIQSVDLFPFEEPHKARLLFSAFQSAILIQQES